MTPGSGCSSFQPGACFTRWWRLQGGAMLHSSVGPSGCGTVWSRSLWYAWAPQPGGGAGRGTGPDQVLELAAGRVPVFGAGVVARSLGDRGEGDVEVAQQCRERGGLPGVGPVAV